jgi:Carbohydrate binding domain (family 11)
VVILAANLIDDMEEGSGGIIKQGGRAGSWFTYDDGSDGGVQTPPAGGSCLPSLIPDGGRCGSLHAMHTFGSGFPVYGAGLGFDLNHASTTRMPYSVSAFTGIAFWALGPQVVEVQIVEQATAATSQGGTCASNCGDHFAKTVDPTSGWQQFQVPFSALSQQGWGTAATWDPTTVLGVQFAVNPAPSFDFWIDDIGFY